MNLTKAELWDLHWNYLRLFTLVTNMRKMFAQKLTARGSKSFVHTIRFARDPKVPIRAVVLAR
jgi:hypothetical protein